MPLLPRDAEELAQALRRGEALLAAGDFPAAEREFAAAAAFKPDAARAAYGLGTARYRLKDWAGAKEAFRAAAERGDASLSAGATFNLGNTAYAEALELLEKAQGAMQAAAEAPGAAAPSGGKESIELVKSRLEEAIKHYRDAAIASPGSRDARANAERATRLLREIQKQEQEQQKQDQQNQDQQNQDQQKQDQKNQDQKNQDQKNQDQKNQDQQNQDQQKQDQQNQDQQNQDQQQQDQQQQQENPQQSPDRNQGQQDQQQKQDESQQGQQKPDQQKPDQPSGDPSDGQPQETQAGAAGGEAREVPLTKEQVDRLLQAVRDREKARRARLEAQRPRRPAPASKDW